MKGSGLTQEKAAEQLGVSRTHLAQIISGAKRPSLSLAIRIERMTGGEVPVESWLDGDEGAA